GGVNTVSRGFGRVKEDYRLCLVGRVLTDSVVHFPSMIRTWANLWHLLGGVSITDIGEKRVLFIFHYEVDINRVIEGMPWSFNRHLIIFHPMGPGEDPLQVPLIYIEFWLQNHNLPMEVISEGLARQFGNSIGQFVQYDSSLVTRGIRRYMQIWVKIDVRMPLK
ncbi:hypothetical protein Goshw_001961, partial [Gossypium schwendimanii]|nr:hypothetical protein [Gossypium schwendimanii]